MLAILAERAASEAEAPNFPVEAVSDAEVRDIYAYVRTFKLDAPAIADVPTLRAILEAAEKPARR